VDPEEFELVAELLRIEGDCQRAEATPLSRELRPPALETHEHRDRLSIEGVLAALGAASFHRILEKQVSQILEKKDAEIPGDFVDPRDAKGNRLEELRDLEKGSPPGRSPGNRARILVSRDPARLQLETVDASPRACEPPRDRPGRSRNS
jgi:hypothetical protein